MSEQSGSFRLTGKHILIFLLLFFGTITLVNIIMIRMALKTFPGIENEKPYFQGLHYNQTLTERAAQAALGWQISLLDEDILVAENTHLELLILDRHENPVSGVELQAHLFRPAGGDGDQRLIWSEQKPGHYIIEPQGLGKGNWMLNITGTAPTGEKLVIEHRLWLN